MPVKLKQIREAVANYMRSEGCGCCGDSEQHGIDHKALGKLLRAKKFPGSDQYDFRRYLPKERR